MVCLSFFHTSSTVLSHFWQIHYFFSFWEVGKRQKTGFSFSPLSLAWEHPYAIYGPMQVCLLLREFLHECARSVVLYVCVCVVFWAPVRAYVYVKCSCICSTMSLWCGGGGGGVCTSGTDIIHQLYVIPIQRSLMSQPFSWQYRAGSWACLSSWEELRCFPCPRFHVFSIMFTCVFASVAF